MTTQEQRFAQFKAIMTFEHHSQHRVGYENFVHCFLSIELAILFNYKKVYNYDIVENCETFINFVAIVVINIRRSIVNGFLWFDPKEDNARIAMIVYIMSTFFNHSCDPNVYWNIIDRNITFITNRDVKPGEDFTISYGPIYNMHYIERQERLKGNAFFTVLYL